MIFKVRRSKVTDYAALTVARNVQNIKPVQNFLRCTSLSQYQNLSLIY